MSRFFFVLTITFLLSNSLKAQNTIQGNVNTFENQPIEYFTVTILNPVDSSIVKGGAFINGDYVMYGISSGKYILGISSLGYSSINKIVTIGMSSNTVFDFALNMSNEELDEVQIRAKRPKVINKSDRYIIDVENTSVSDAGNALNALSKTPFVIVDHMTGEISVAGRSSSMILINGRKITSNQELEMLSSQNIKQIEVIENPSAKYEAEGHSVINIITTISKDKGVNANLRSLYTRGRHNSGQLYGDITYVANKFVLFSQYGFIANNKEGFNSTVERYEKDGYSFESNNHNTDNTDNIRMNEYAFGVNFHPTKAHAINFKYEGNSGRIASQTVNEMDVKKNGHVYPTEISNQDTDNTPFRNSLNFSYNYNKADFEFALIADYTKSNTKSSSYIKEHDINNTYQNIKRNNWSSEFDLISAQYDFKIPIKVVKSSLDFGSRFSKVTSDNKSIFFDKVSADWISNSEFTNNVDLSENIFGSYFVLSGQLSEKMTYSVGLRYEYSETKNQWDVHKDSINNFSTSNYFPSLLVTRKVNEDISFRFSYSKRIKRPSYNSLNNSVWYINSHSTRQGNPYLKPTMYNTFSASSKIKKINASVNISYIQNPKDLVYINDAVEIENNVVKYINTDNRWSYSLNISSSYQSKFWSIQPFFSVSFMERSIFEDGIKYTTDYPGVYLSLRNQFDVGKSTFIDFDLKYRKPSHSFKEFNDQYDFSLALRHKLLKNKMTVQIAYQYIPSLWNQKMDYSYKNIDFTWDGDDRNILTVSLRCSFNSIEKRFKSKTSSKEELRRM